MTGRTVSVKQAIELAERQIGKPCRLGTSISIVGSLLLPMLGFSWWYLLLFPSAVVLCFFYTRFSVWKWCAWAYNAVNDIHQLQRSGELAGYFRRGNYERDHPRFAEPVMFYDDVTIPDETPINENTF